MKTVRYYVQGYNFKTKKWTDCVQGAPLKKRKIAFEEADEIEESMPTARCGEDHAWLKYRVVKRTTVARNTVQNRRVKP